MQVSLLKLSLSERSGPDNEHVKSKACSKCQVEKPLTSFAEHPNGRLGRNSVCKPCARERDRRKRQEPGYREALIAKKKQWRQANREKALRTQRSSTLKRKYGMTADEWDGMFADQGCACAICGKLEGRFHTDHDHETGKLRSILCHTCNVTIGMMRDDPDLLTKAAEYLRHHSR